MSIGDAFAIAFHALATNKLRTALTMLGIIIGVCAVIAMIAIGQGAQQQVVSRISSLGTDLLYIRPGAQQQNGVRTAAGTAPTLSIDDGQAIAQNVDNVKAVVPVVYGNAQVIYQGQNVNTRIIGTTPAYQDVHSYYPADGDFFTDQDVTAASPVIVLGSNVAQQLFGDTEPVGQTVRVSAGRISIPFRVVGVMQSKGSLGFVNVDDQVLMPLTTLARKIQVNRNTRGGQLVDELDVQVTSTDVIPAVTQQIDDLLRTRHQVAQDDFTILSPLDFLSTLSSAIQAFTILLGSIAGISLVVGGIGIMNIMLVSVTERTREIGIRKAMGARRRDILTQFLIEAVTVSLIGGAAGILLGVGAAHVLNGLPIGTGMLTTAIVPSSIVLAFTVAAVVGIVSGIYPAMRAASLNPIEALRYE
jgi:putative ABC transport system permease protein